MAELLVRKLEHFEKLSEADKRVLQEATKDSGSSLRTGTSSASGSGLITSICYSRCSSGSCATAWSLSRQPAVDRA